MSQLTDENPDQLTPQLPPGRFEEALSYVDRVKFKFQAQPQVYANFLDIFMKYKTQRMGLSEMISRVSNLFSGHPELLVGFSAFIPADYKVQLHNMGGCTSQDCGNTVKSASSTLPVTSSVLDAVFTDESSPTSSTFALNGAHHDVSQLPIESSIHKQRGQNQLIGYDQAIIFVNKVKKCFQGQPDKYSRFLEILQAYKDEQNTLSDSQLQLSCTKMYLQMVKLFEKHEDLLTEFGQFLPNTTSNSSGNDVTKANINNDITNFIRRFIRDLRLQKPRYILQEGIGH